MASIVQSHLVGGTLIPANSEHDMINQIRNSTETRLHGCFLNGTGAKTYENNFVIGHNYNVQSLNCTLTGIVFDLTKPDISYTLRLRHETPTLERDREKWYTYIRSPAINPSGPRVYDK